NLDFWTYLGGTEDGITGDRALAVAVDTAGAVYAAGSTYAADFPTTPGAFDPDFDQTCICADGFVVKLSASGSNLLWGTFLGADGEDTVEALELDAFGHLVLAGATGSAGFPVTPDAFDVTLSGESDAFIARLDASGSILLYATYLGGSAGESARGIDVTLQGRILVTGWTDSADFPTTPGSFDPVHNFDKDVFVTVLVPPRAGAPVEVFLPLIQRKGE
ncbi:MAG TPA: hypothetical protein VMN57_15470, partial [Anaerolineales bacterium]|nr:hypothetical protein [Anaerolineales bacterium]